jgi:hypothetical protein
VPSVFRFIKYGKAAAVGAHGQAPANLAEMKHAVRKQACPGIQQPVIVFLRVVADDAGRRADPDDVAFRKDYLDVALPYPKVSEVRVRIDAGDISDLRRHG